VNLPETSAPSIPTEDERLVVTIAADRKIFINEYAVELESLGPKLAAIYRNQQGRQGVFLRADESIAYGFVMQVMATIREMGIEKIGMVTEPLKSSP
jgi:biopolymer transport protein TolR